MVLQKIKCTVNNKTFHAQIKISTFQKNVEKEKGRKQLQNLTFIRNAVKGA